MGGSSRPLPARVPERPAPSARAAATCCSLESVSTCARVRTCAPSAPAPRPHLRSARHGEGFARRRSRGPGAREGGGEEGANRGGGEGGGRSLRDTRPPAAC